MKLALLFLLNLISYSVVFAQVTLYYQDFEGMDFDTYTLYDGSSTSVSFNQSSDNYILRDLPNNVPVGNTISGFTGNVIALEDTDDAGFFGDPFIRTNTFSISGYSNITIEITFAAGSGADGSIYESSDFLDVDYRIDGGGGWQQAHRLEGSASGKFWYDAASDGITETGDDINVDQNAQVFAQSFSVSGSFMELRITMGSRGDDEEMMFDDIHVQAIIPCADPTISSFTSSADSICAGDSVILEVAGTLNDATAWHLYSSNCGTTSVANSITGSFTVVPTASTTYFVRGEDGTGCLDESSMTCLSTSIFVRSLPTVSLSGLPNFCNNDSIQTNMGGATPSGGVYSGPGVTDNGNGITFSFNPTIAGPGVHSVSYLYADTNGCNNSASDSIEITLNPTAALVTTSNYCIDAGPQIANGGTPAGGTYSGIGITDFGDGINFSFEPNALGVGFHQVWYTFSDSLGCDATETSVFEIFGLPAIDAGSDVSLCEGDSAILSGSGGVSFSWDNGVIDNNPFEPTIGTSQFVLTGTDTNGCSNTDTVLVFVDTIPNVYAGMDQSFCQNDSIVLSGSNADTYAWDNGVLNGIPFTQAIGTTTYSVIGTNLSGCSNTDHIDVTVFALPDTSITLNAGSATANDTNATYQWINCTTGVLVPGETSQSLSNYSGYFALVVSQNGCQDTSSCFLLSTVDVHSSIIDDIRIYPNPSKGKFFIDLGSETEGTLLVMDSMGKQVVSCRLQGEICKVSLPNATSGIYFLKIEKMGVFYQKTIVFE